MDPRFLEWVPVSAAEIDEYLHGVGQPKRDALEALGRTILEIVPDAQECISYRIPAFRVNGKVFAAFAAFTEHLSYLPCQRLRPRPARRRARRLHDDQERPALHARAPAAGSARAQADRSAPAAAQPTREIAAIAPA